MPQDRGLQGDGYRPEHAGGDDGDRDPHVVRAQRRVRRRREAFRKQVQLLEAELRTTSQRVNLFEKVKIPEARENIRVIQVFIGDQQTAAVVRGKIAKKKLVEV